MPEFTLERRTLQALHRRLPRQPDHAISPKVDVVTPIGAAGLSGGRAAAYLSLVVLVS
jgi:hypothetical protein